MNIISGLDDLSQCKVHQGSLKRFKGLWLSKLLFRAILKGFVGNSISSVCTPHRLSLQKVHLKTFVDWFKCGFGQQSTRADFLRTHPQSLRQRARILLSQITSWKKETNFTAALPWSLTTTILWWPVLANINGYCCISNFTESLCLLLTKS